MHLQYKRVGSNQTGKYTVVVGVFVTGLLDDRYAFSSAPLGVVQGRGSVVVAPMNFQLIERNFRMALSPRQISYGTR